jgi:hypothetical protein
MASGVWGRGRGAAGVRRGRGFFQILKKKSSNSQLHSHEWNRDYDDFLGDLFALKWDYNSETQRWPRTDRQKFGAITMSRPVAFLQFP